MIAPYSPFRTKALIWEAVELRNAEQDPDELEWLAGQLAERPPQTVLEIGVRAGGLLWLWQNLYPRAAVWGVDLNLPPCPDCDARLAHRCCPREPRGGEMIVGDSADSGVSSYVLAHAGPFDLLYIDGDHTAAGVQADYDTYAPNVRPGGAIVFHDAASQPCPDVGAFCERIGVDEVCIGTRGAMGTALKWV